MGKKAVGLTDVAAVADAVLVARILSLRGETPDELVSVVVVYPSFAVSFVSFISVRVRSFLFAYIPHT